MLIGHMVGDYLLQNDWMARNKMLKTDDGRFACVVHCVIYSFSIALFTVVDGWRCFESIGVSLFAAFAIAFATHFFIDRDSLGKKWINMYGQSKLGTDNPFAPLVYVAVDNTLHLVLMWMLFSWLSV